LADFFAPSVRFDDAAALLRTPRPQADAP